MSASQHYEFRRKEKENQTVEKTKRRIGKRPSDDGVVALEETNAASPQRMTTLDTHESPWRWEREESEEDLPGSGLPRKKENVRKKKRRSPINCSKPISLAPDCTTEQEMVMAIMDLAHYGEKEVGALHTQSNKKSLAQKMKSLGKKC